MLAPSAQFVRMASTVLAALLFGCGDWMAAIPTAPVPEPTAPIPQVVVDFAARSPQNQNGLPGVRAPYSPTVVVRDSVRGIRGVEVTFAVTTGGGSVTASHAVTDYEGIATSGYWVLGAAEGPNRIVATIDRPTATDPVVFDAVGVRPVPLFTRNPERFDLISVAGQPLPRYWTVRAHYLFWSNGAFTFSSIGPDSVAETGTWNYAIDPITAATLVMIDFPINPQGTGTLVGDTLHVTYSDFIDWEPEIYVRIVDP